ncbi:transporter [Bacillus cereus]|uniref:transporter n=1 Tax=Bacillus cereus TaxID=1396 RepID=UPI000BF57EFB|nr:transporter [Bacillus cereus]PEQ94787.1 transporter [Bacillus cereus]
MWNMLLKVIVTIGLWLYLFPVILNPDNVPFRFLLYTFSDDIAGTFFNYMYFSIGYVIYFVFVLFMSHKVIWSNTLTQIERGNKKVC